MSTIDAHTALQAQLEAIEYRIPGGQVTFNPQQRRRRLEGFGDIYPGQHNGTNVCVKVLDLERGGPDLRDWRKFLRIFKREVKIWRGLDHPNVVRFIGWSFEEKEGRRTVSLISSWCDGGNVKDYLQEHPSADRHGLICGVSRGLAYLHSQGIVHGNIKPANILVARRRGARDDAQLCDFRLSSILSDISTYTQTSSILPTIRYVSPELLYGSERLTRESDIWAFGCVSAEILTDQRPFSWLSPEWKIASVMDSQPPYDRKDDGEFWTHIATCFERVPEKRPSIDELVMWLELASLYKAPLGTVPTIHSDTALRILRRELQEIESCILEDRVTYNPEWPKGRGSFGDVYLGQHEGINVCVKVLSLVGKVLELKNWQRFLRVLKREVKTWRGLDHPNVVRFIGWKSEEWEGGICVSLISSWCDGGNVTEYLGDHLCVDRHGLVCGISRGLAHLHSRGIVHGDIKPANVVVACREGAGDDAQLCDFGLSCILGDTSTYPDTLSIAASLRYASPELLSGSEDDRTRESDIWAFGCTSAEILTGRCPFSWISNEWQILSVVNSQLPYNLKDDDRFWTHITTCFEHVPERRPTMDKLAMCLRLDSGDSPYKAHTATISSINSNTALRILRTELQEIESRIPEGQVTYNPQGRRGRGTFGDVYLGQHEGIKDVCVKVLSLEGTVLELESWKKFLQVLKRAVKMWRGLDHPNVTRFIGWMSKEWEGGISVSLISSWCDGGNIKEYLREYPNADRHGLICDVGRGLAYLHSQGIVHGNIKPSNIVVARGGKASDNAQLCDFELSCILSSVSTYAYSSSTAASSRYASPELLSSSENRQTRECDIWAFGCAVAEILTDRPPFSGVINELTIPSVANSQLPYDLKDDGGFWTRIATCFERDPEKRPSMDELVMYLEELPRTFYLSEVGNE